MRPLLIGSMALLIASIASAEPAPLEERRGDRPFWSWVLAPHATEIDVVLEKVDENRQVVSQATSGVDFLAIRDRALDDALGMLRFARRLEPDDRNLLRIYGEVAAQRGFLAEAAAAFEAYLDGTDHTENNPIRGQLGQIYAQQGRYGEAVGPLRAGVAAHSHGAIHNLASVYMQRGRLAEAIDLLEHAPETHELILALAVACDRDEQVGRAAETLEKLISMLAGTGSRLGAMHDNIGVIYTPAVDQHYFEALLLEAGGHLIEARAAWMAYARAWPAPRFRDRALAHVAAIDTMQGADK